MKFLTDSFLFLLICSGEKSSIGCAELNSTRSSRLAVDFCRRISNPGGSSCFLLLLRSTLHTMTTRIPTRAKSIFFLLSATGATAVAIQASNPNFPITSRDLVTDFPQRIGAGFSATVRSSRAIYTIASNVVDYKYSLHGMDVDSAEYRAHLSQVHLRAARRILQLCETNKGFYVKAGQFIAAMRQVPKEYTATLSCLQDQFLVISKL